jgi:hypothetical protein
VDLIILTDENPNPEQKANYRKAGIAMIVIGLLIMLTVSGIGFFLLGAGVITLLTNLDDKTLKTLNDVNIFK